MAERHHALPRYPAPTQLPRLLLRPDAHVVMVNLLVLKPMATGAYRGRSGREAYQD